MAWLTVIRPSLLVADEATLVSFPANAAIRYRSYFAPATGSPVSASVTSRTAVPGTGKNVRGVWRITAPKDGAEGPAAAAEAAAGMSAISRTDASRTAVSLRTVCFMSVSPFFVNGKWKDHRGMCRIIIQENRKKVNLLFADKGR